MNSYLMTDKGIARNNNQDDVLSVTKENGDSLYVLCDGMGGHMGGATACKKCINVFKKEFVKSKYNNVEDAKNWLYNHVLKANKEIITENLERFKHFNKTSVKLINPVTNECITLNGTQAAADYLGVTRQAISGACKQGTLCKGYKVLY